LAIDGGGRSLAGSADQEECPERCRREIFREFVHGIPGVEGLISCFGVLVFSYFLLSSGFFGNRLTEATYFMLADGIMICLKFFCTCCITLITHG
jgi:hypothetical protein